MRSWASDLGLTIDSRQINPPVNVPLHEVEVLGHFLQDEQVTREEELALEHRRRRILGFQCFRSTN